MAKAAVMIKPKHIEIQNIEEMKLGQNEVRVETLYTGISAGTQLTIYRGNTPFARKQFDGELRLFEDTDEQPEMYPVIGCDSYEEVGRIVELGSDVKVVKQGDIVYGDWGHNTSAILEDEFVAEHMLPEGLDPICGIFSQMGSIAFNAILDADIHLGETVAIFGQGVPGQIVMQLAKLSGANVIAVDLNENRLSYSTKFGADIVLNPSNCNVAREIRMLTGKRGADLSIEISGSSAALHQAIRSTCYNGRVVCSGFFPGPSNGLFLGEEFHHNRINLLCSQIRRISPSLSHRWTKNRMEQTIMKLQQQGKLDLKGLITHKFNFEDVAKAYDMLDECVEDCLQVVLNFK